MALNDLYRITIQGRLHMQLTVNVFHWLETTATTSTDPEFIIQGVVRNTGVGVLGPVLPTQLAFASTQWTATDVTVQRIRPTALIPRLFPFAPIAGTHTGDALPSFVSGVLSFRGTLAGRRNRGRMFVPGIAESQQDAGRLTATALTELDTHGLAMRSAVHGESGIGSDPGRWTLVIFSRRALQLGLGFTTTVTTSVAREILGTTRSRKIGVGV